MTDIEIIKALECCIEGDCDNCEYQDDTPCKEYLFYACLDLINRQKAEIERLEIEGEETRYKLECLLCHSTGGRLSKSTYPLRTMETAVTDYINECYDEIEAEVRAEAVKEFAERLKEHPIKTGIPLRDIIDNLVKEFTEGKDNGK